MSRSNTDLDYSKYVPNDSLDTLDLSNKQIKDRDIPGIVGWLRNHPEITNVFLDGNLIGPEGVEKFAIENTTATYVNFGRNPVGNAGFRRFAEKNRVVTNAVFAACNIDHVGAKQFAENNTTVIRLNIAGNELGDKGIRALGEKNTVAMTAFLSDNKITEKGILDFFNVNNNLVVNLGDQSERVNQECLEHNKKVEDKRERAKRAYIGACVMIASASAETAPTPSVTNATQVQPPNPSLAVMPLISDILKMAGFAGTDDELKTSFQNLMTTSYYQSQTQGAESKAPSAAPEAVSLKDGKRAGLASSLWKPRAPGPSEESKAPQQNQKQRGPAK